jgi:hypothetical protein
MSEKSRRPKPADPDGLDEAESVPLQHGDATEVRAIVARRISTTDPDPDSPEDEVVDQHAGRRLLNAQIKEKQAATQWLKTGSRDRKARTDAERERIQVEIANENRLAETRIENENKLVDAHAGDLKRRREARIKDRKAWTDAEIADQSRRTEAGMDLLEARAEGIRRRDRTWQVGQFFWMGVSAFGLLVSLVLALATADASMLGERLSPLGGLAISAGGGIQFHLLNRPESGPGSEAADETEQAHEKGGRKARKKREG